MYSLKGEHPKEVCCKRHDTHPPARIANGVPHMGQVEEANTYLSSNTPLSGLGGSQQGRSIPVSHRHPDYVVTLLCYLCRKFWHKNVQSFLPCTEPQHLKDTLIALMWIVGQCNVQCQCKRLKHIPWYLTALRMALGSYRFTPSIFMQNI